ncbi:MAG: TlpA family protein disulfide reductase [Candidatus Omnitrophica bacterium]|nr:TlpA family protein disulfide reductase [Candidatus Omnitrophota bacterium]
MRRVLFLIVFLFCLVSASCAQKGDIGSSGKVQDFTLEDIKGNEVNLNETISTHTVTLLVFGATWCPYCREEAPELIRLNREYKNKGLKILAIDIGESKKKVESFIRQEGIDYTVLLDIDNKVASRYGIIGIPTNILIDKEGNIKYRGAQLPPEELLP